jgi:lactate permease
MHNLGLSGILAVLPVVFLFAVLLSKKMAGYLATLCTLILALAVAILFYGMPYKLAYLSGLDGIMNGLFPIGWIVFAAVFLYNLSVRSGGFAIVRDTIESITADRRLQALLIAFCFGAFLEGAAGFGAPVAITAGMLVGLGFNSLYAAGICLISNTAPVAFGGIGIAVVTAGKLTDIDPNVISRMVAHQLPLLALLLPFWLVIIISGWKGMKEVWPAALVAGGSYSLTMYLVATYLGPFLPDILSALVSIICLVLFLRIWQPKEVWRFPEERHTNIEHSASKGKKHTLKENVWAWTPFVLLVLFISNWGSAGISHVLSKVTVLYAFPLLNGGILVGSAPIKAVYSFGWLSAAGTAIFCAAIVSSIILRFSWKMVIETLWETLKELRNPLITIASIVGFAYVANFAGFTSTFGSILAKTGHLFPFLAPVLGWIGVFITGSDTSSNALFCGTQKVAANQLGINPVLTVTANTTGGVTAKMISPQSIAVATASSKLTGQEGALFRFTVLHSLGFLLIICLVTYVQAYYLKGMVPSLVSGAAKAVTQLSMGEWTLLGGSVLFLVILSCWNLIGDAIKPAKSGQTVSVAE